MKLIDKTAVVAEIERRKKELMELSNDFNNQWACGSLDNILSFLDTLEVKEVDLDIKKRIKECPFRQVVCNRYEDTPILCDGRCSWVADYPKLKELKAQKGE